MTKADDRRRFSELLARYRKHAGYSQSALGKAIGVTGATISGWELGSYGPANRGTAAELDAFLGAGGELLAALGFTPPTGNDLAAKIEELDARLAELEEVIRRRSRGAGPPNGPTHRGGSR